MTSGWFAGPSTRWGTVALMQLLWPSLALAQAPGQPPGFWEELAQEVPLPLAVIIAAVAVAFVVLNQQRSTDGSIDVESRRIDLQSTVDESVETLRQLELEQSKMDREQYEAERRAILGRGAHAMQALEGKLDDSPDAAPAGATRVDSALADAAEVHESPPTPGAPGLPAPASPAAGGLLASMSPEWRGALYAVGVMLLLLGLSYVAKSFSTERLEGMGMTGGEIVNRDNSPAEEGAAGQLPPQLTAQRDAWDLRLQQDPNDMTALNGLTGVYLNANMPREAFENNQKALQNAPQDATARAYLGALTMMMGMPEKALQHVEGVLKDEPRHELALPYKGLFLMELGRFDEAVAVLEEAQKVNPNVAQALEQARALARGEDPAASAPVSGDLIVSGTVQIAPAAAAMLRGGETVFVSVKDPGRPGPPVAADRMAASFPGRFELTTADIRAMPGADTTVPDAMVLTVRVDLDGNAMTRENAPMAEIPVRRGASNVVVTLQVPGAPASPAPSAAGGASQVLVSGVARLGAGATASPGQTLFISVKDPSGGPPLAAERLVGANFPLPFEVTTANLLPMAGNRPIPDRLLVSVRLDNDGNASTKDGEPEANASGVQKGTTGLELTLQ